MRLPAKDPILQRKIIIPTDEQRYMLWELMGVYADLMRLSGKMSQTPFASLDECKQFTKNVKSVLGGNPCG